MVATRRVRVIITYSAGRRGKRTIRLPDNARDICAQVHYVLEEARHEDVPITLSAEPIRATVQLAGEEPSEPINPEEVAQK